MVTPTTEDVARVETALSMSSYPRRPAITTKKIQEMNIIIKTLFLLLGISIVPNKIKVEGVIAPIPYQIALTVLYAHFKDVPACFGRAKKER